MKKLLIAILVSVIVIADNETNENILKLDTNADTNLIHHIEYQINGSNRLAFDGQKLYWTIEDKEYNLWIETNNTVLWSPIAESKDKVQQVGKLQTNRSLVINLEKSTNFIILNILGIEDWPSQKRIINK